MAKEVKKPETEAGGATATAAKEPAEAVYAAVEFAGNAARLFGEKATADLVIAAFRLEGKENATLSEAKGIVEKFMNKEVK